MGTLRAGIILVMATAMACGNSPTGGDDDGTGGGSNGSNDPPYKPPYENCAGGAQQPPPSGSLCLGGTTTPPSAPPLAVIEHWFEQYMGVPAVHVRVTLDPTFVDNTYGTTRVGWTKGHSFEDLEESDRAQVKVLDAQGRVVFDIYIDYISADPSAPCGYRSLGVDGGEGSIVVGDRAAILGWSTSLGENLNERGYCSYLTDSPATDAMCTPNAAAPDWDFRVVYDIWFAASAFTPDPFGSAHMSYVHASPSKLMSNSVAVEPEECPCVEIDINQCQPPPEGGCMSNADCPQGESFCYDGYCIPIIL